MQKLRIPFIVLSAVALAAALVFGAQGNTVGVFLAGIASAWMACAAVAAFDLMAGLTLTAFVGAGVSVYLARQHLVVSTGIPSICSVNSTFDCDAVNTSKWSEIFGIPLALFGFGFYSALGFLALAARMGRTGYRGALPLLRLAGVSALLYSGFLAWVSHSLGKWCLFCISLYGVNGLLLVLSWWGVRNHVRIPGLGAEPLPPLSRVLFFGGGDRSMGTALAAGLVPFVLGVLIFQGQKNESGAATTSGSASTAELARLYFKPAGPVELDGTEPVFGDPGARFLIVEWADYACPYCARAGAEVKEIVKKNPDIQLRYKHYPISGNCNRFVEGPRHATACDASFAAECARQQGRFWELNDLLFKNQQYQSASDIEFMATQTGLDMAQFKTCLVSPATRSQIEADVEAAGRVDISGTPSFFLRGLFGDDFVELKARPEDMLALIEAARNGVALPAPSSRKSDE